MRELWIAIAHEQAPTAARPAALSARDDAATVDGRELGADCGGSGSGGADGGGGGGVLRRSRAPLRTSTFVCGDFLNAPPPPPIALRLCELQRRQKIATHDESAQNRSLTNGHLSACQLPPRFALLADTRRQNDCAFREAAAHSLSAVNKQRTQSK